MADGSSVSSEGRRTSPATFYRQVVAELRKVVWPTRQQLITYFIVVMVFVIVVMTFVSLLDLGFDALYLHQVATDERPGEDKNPAAAPTRTPASASLDAFIDMAGEHLLPDLLAAETPTTSAEAAR